MMKLYYSTATCSTACRIALEEIGLNYTPMEVSWERNINIAELDELNPLGAVPVLVSEDGKTLTQNTAILEYLADLSPSCHLLAEKGAWERSETMSWVAFVASDLQKAFSPIFQAKQITSSESAQMEIKKFAVKKIQELLEYLDRHLAGKSYIVGKQFTIADIYLFTVVGWTKWVEVDTRGYKNLTSYMVRVFDRPAVQSVLKKEDLLDYLQ